eukprot:8729562-Lingulodinium_polyedra.AAC.1
MGKIAAWPRSQPSSTETEPGSTLVLTQQASKHAPVLLNILLLRALAALRRRGLRRFCGA